MNEHRMIVHRFTQTGNAGNYFSYGVAVTEVELDVLTGQVQIPRVDILYDCGNRQVSDQYN